MRTSKLRKSVKRSMRLFTSAVAIGAVIAVVPAGAEDAHQIEIRIEAQSLDAALNAFAQKIGKQIVLYSDDASGLMAETIDGTYTEHEVLNLILADSGLNYKYVNDRTIAVGTPTRLASVEGARRDEPFHMAQLDQENVLEVTPSDRRAEFGDGEGRDQVVVTGTRLRRFGEGPSPVVTFDNETIKALGVTDIADVLDYLPQSSYSLGEDFIVGGAKPVQLRGLNFGTTLLLINGRRVVTSAVQGNRNFFDLNTLPISAVERVEVLSESASAVYGADAIGGVVNVILKETSDATTFDVYYGGAQGGGDEFRASATTGFQTDSFRTLIGADYFNRSYLHGDQRERFFDQDYTRFGGPDYRSTLSNPGNVVSLGGPLPGLASSQAGVPPGQGGVGLTPADFAETQGPAGLNRESLRRYASVVPESERVSVFANGELDFAESVTLFGEFLFTHREEARQLAPTTLSNGGISNTAGTLGGIFAPPTNPFNPFGAPVLVNYLFEGAGPREELVDNDFYRIAGGFRGDIGRWNYELAVMHTRDNSTQSTTNEVDPVRVVTALAQTDPASALNLFADGPAGSPALLASLIAEPNPGTFGSFATQVGGFVSGPLFALPAGDVEIVVGGEWRSEKLDFVIPSGLAVNLQADRTTGAAFGEILIPLVSDEMGAPLLNELTFTAALRYDHYSDFGGTLNPKLGLEWRPVADLLLRGAWGTSYRAPSLFELYFDRTMQMGQFPDPLRPPQFPGLPGELVVITLTSGGNPDLKPEEAESFSIGAVYQPAFVEGLDLSVDYFNIEQNLRVQSPDAFALILNADLFPGRVTRAAQTPADIAAGLPGMLLALDVSRLNLGSVETDGIDFRVRYSAETGIGTFSPSLSATWVHSYKVADFPGHPLENRVGKASRDPGTVPEWKAVAGLNWFRNGFQGGASVRFVDSYQDVSVSGADLDRRVPEQWYLDLNASYRFGDSNAVWGVLDGVTLRIGAVNVLDRDVAYSDVNIIGYDPSQADIRGRFVYGAISKEF